MIKSFIEKLNNKRGESFVEVLVAIVSVSLASALLVAGIQASNKLNSDAIKLDQQFESSNESAVNQSDESNIGNGNVNFTLTDDSSEKSVNVQYYGNGDLISFDGTAEKVYPSSTPPVYNPNPTGNPNDYPTPDPYGVVIVTFNTNGGSLIAMSNTKEVICDKPYGDLPECVFTGYRFDGWYTDLIGGTKVTSETICTTRKAHTLYAHWVKVYTITWQNYDNTVLARDQVDEGTIPTYKGKTPVCTKDVGTKYESRTFKGWSPTVTAANKNQTYIAQYDSKLKEYTVTWRYIAPKDSSGTTYKINEDKQTYYWQDTPTFDSVLVTVKSNNSFSVFAKWDKDIKNVTSNVTYSAIYTEMKESYSHVGSSSPIWVEKKDWLGIKYTVVSDQLYCGEILYFEGSLLKDPGFYVVTSSKLTRQNVEDMSNEVRAPMWANDVDYVEKYDLAKYYSAQTRVCDDYPKKQYYPSVTKVYYDFCLDLTGKDVIEPSPQIDYHLLFSYNGEYYYAPYGTGPNPIDISNGIPVSSDLSRYPDNGYGGRGQFGIIKLNIPTNYTDIDTIMKKL